MSKSQDQRALAEQREQLFREGAKLVQKWHNLDHDGDYAAVYANRYEVPPPEPTDKSKYNPNNLIDIETFIKHPHFLNLTPYPWQTLALKIFYSGIEGNINVQFNESKKEEEEGCSSCVWNYVRENEESCAKSIESEKPYLSILKPENSRCLKCERCPIKTREIRLKHEIEISSDKDAEKVLMNILEEEPEDLFQSEMDLIEEIPDETVKIQIKNKLKNKFQELVLIMGRRGSKLLDLKTPILTTSGWKTMGSVNIGDYVFGPDGKPTQVVGKSEINYTEEAYEMHFSNGEVIVAGENHQWQTLTKSERKNSIRRKGSKIPVSKIFTTKEIANSLTYGAPRRMLKKGSKTERNIKLSVEFNHAIEITKPLIYQPQQLELHPYLLGVFLGDGTKSSNTITGIDIEIFDYIQANCEYDIRHSFYNLSSHYVSKHRITDKSFVSLLKKENLFNNKHIPRKYLEASIEQRLELLRGLNDTDGSVSRHNCVVHFVNTNKQLAYEYYELANGLGFKTTIKERDAKLYGKVTSKCYIISYSVPRNTTVFNLSRKQSIIDNKNSINISAVNRVFITNCIPVKNKGMQCIEVDSPNHLYLAGNSLIPTHNSFMTVAMALYELYRLLSLKHPQKILKLPDFQEIHILNVAKNEDQAKDSIFTPMKNIAVASPFFQKYIGIDNELEMKFLTENDIEENSRRELKGLKTLLGGTIILKCGSSSGSGLVGKTCWLIILDELAAMIDDSPNSSKDKKLYDDLKPSLTTFGKDGKMISLSQPKGPFGQLFRLYNDRLPDSTTLVLKLPTWIINANVDKLWLEGERRKDPIEFNMQYGAEFGTNSQDPYLTPEDVKYAFDNSSVIKRAEEREVGCEYYCHVDPANSSDYYALAVAHAVPTGERDGFGKPIKQFIVDHLHYWAPAQMKQPIQSKDVKDYIINLHARFQFKQISFDQWHSSQIVQELVAMGIPAVIKIFNKEYKDKIYINLLEAFRTKRVKFYRMSAGKVLDKKGNLVEINEIPEAINQFTFLQKKWKNGKQTIGALTGYKDDICDAVSGALFECLNETAKQNVLPKARLVYTGPKFR